MLKKDFMQKVSSMKRPVIEQLSPDENNGLLNECWVIRDKDDFRNKFCTPVVKLMYSEYLSSDHSKYCARVESYRKKYNRWLKSHLRNRLKKDGE